MHTVHVHVLSIQSALPIHNAVQPGKP